MMFANLIARISVLSTLACMCQARIKTFNEVIEYGVNEETREVFGKCWLNHVTNHNDVIASGKDLVFKCSGLSQQTITYRQCDRKCNLPKKCLKNKQFVNEPERKVVKIERLFDKKVFNAVVPIRCECKILRKRGKKRRNRKRKSKVVMIRKY